MNYADWLKTVPCGVSQDPLWTLEAYRLALFAADIAWQDAGKLGKERRTRGISGQLYEAVGSVSANIAEGYSRGSARDRARFYEYALGSARESRTWYWHARHVIGESVTAHRLNLATQLIRLLLVMVPDQRGNVLYDSATPYQPAASLQE